MKPVIVVADDFFPDPMRVRHEILLGTFEDFKSPWDSVSYPGINKDMPVWIVEYVTSRLKKIAGLSVAVQAIFARVTCLATGPAPHQIHSDRIMGQYSAHIYLSTDWPEGSGTSFWTHKTEGPLQTDKTDVPLVLKDMNDPAKWSHSMTCQGKFNRLLIHDACAWHCAEPVGGWGDGPDNGRIVLTCFFNAADAK